MPSTIAVKNNNVNPCTVIGNSAKVKPVRSKISFPSHDILTAEKMNRTIVPKKTYVVRRAKDAVQWLDTKNVVADIQSGKILKVFEERTSYCKALLKSNPTHGLGACINRIKKTKMMECSCQTFDRINFANVRTHYEDATIDLAVNEVNAQLAKKSSFELVIAVESPGKLASEAVLMTRMMQKLEGKQGKIRLMLMDEEYKGIKSAGTITDLEFRAAQNDFLSLLATLQSNAQSIDLTAVFFESSADYKTACYDNEKFRHNLFIGSDLGGKKPSDLLEVYVATQRNTRSRISLLYAQNEGQPIYWNGKKEIALDVQKNSEKEQSEEFPWKLALFGVGLVAALIFGIYYINSGNKKKRASSVASG